MLRVSAFGGKKILVLLKTLVSGAMREMRLISLFSFKLALKAFESMLSLGSWWPSSSSWPL